MLRWRFRRLVVGVFLYLPLSLLYLLGCNRSDDSLPYVELERGAQGNVTSAVEAASGVLRIAGAPMISPMEGLVYYRQMLTYLAAKLHRPVDLVQRKTYYEIDELLRSGAVGAAFICSGAFILDAEPSRIEILVVPYANGHPYYYSYLITNVASSFGSMEELRGRSFAFSDPLSLSGRYYVMHRLRRMGETPETFFSRILYSGGHDSSIRAVAAGEVDAAGVDSLIYEYMRIHGSPESLRTQVIERSEPLGIPPFVVSPHLDSGTREALKKTLLAMDEDVEGQRILKNLGLDRFEVPPPGLYTHVREILRNLKP